MRLVQNVGLVEVIQDGFCRISIVWIAALARRIPMAPKNFALLRATAISAGVMQNGVIYQARGVTSYQIYQLSEWEAVFRARRSVHPRRSEFDGNIWY